MNFETSFGDANPGSCDLSTPPALKQAFASPGLAVTYAPPANATAGSGASIALDGAVNPRAVEGTKTPGGAL